MNNERIKFYADTPSGDRNKLFCFNLTSILTLKNCIFRFFAKGYNFRSVYYEKIDYETGKCENQRIPKETINELFEEFENLTPKQRKLYY